MYIFDTVLHLREDAIIEFIFCFYLIPRLASDDQAVKAFGYFDYKTFKAFIKTLYNTQVFSTRKSIFTTKTKCIYLHEGNCMNTYYGVYKWNCEIPWGYVMGRCKYKRLKVRWTAPEASQRQWNQEWKCQCT